MVERNGTAIIPNGDLVLQESDLVILYSQVYLNHDSKIEI